MTATLYGIPGSHAVRTGELMLEHKGIDFRRVNLPPGPHRVLVRLFGFPGDRVPAVKFADGRRAQGTRGLPRVLDEMLPEPRLVPEDPRALEAEVWADKVLQQWARRMGAAALVRDIDSVYERGADGRMGRVLAPWLWARRLVALSVHLAFRINSQRRREDPQRMEEMFGRVDAMIADGVIGGEQLNCADFQIVPSLALVDNLLTVRDELRSRPAGRLMERLLPEA
jgi:glutathione S-transferase